MTRQVLATNKLSCFAAHKLSGFMMVYLGVHDEADRVVTGDEKDAI